MPTAERTVRAIFTALVGVLDFARAIWSGYLPSSGSRQGTQRLDPRFFALDEPASASRFNHRFVYADPVSGCHCDADSCCSRACGT
jgi:hypothetical protein